jgi:hypothetical protein
MNLNGDGDPILSPKPLSRSCDKLYCNSRKNCAYYVMNLCMKMNKISVI